MPPTSILSPRSPYGVRTRTVRRQVPSRSHSKRSRRRGLSWYAFRLFGVGLLAGNLLFGFWALRAQLAGSSEVSQSGVSHLGSRRAPTTQSRTVPQATRPARRAGSRVAGGRTGLWKKVWVTAYCPRCPRCQTTDLTATGRHASRPGVAVARHQAKRVVPLGSKVYIPAVGWLPVDDVGGKVGPAQFDLRMQSHAQARHFGRRQMVVRIERPGAS
jgi:3D (Asp-Asp-Asp) domain-containing protein